MNPGTGIRIWLISGLAMVWCLGPAVLLGQAQNSQLLPREQFKDGQKVLDAFREVVKEAGPATVEVSIDREQVALGTVVGSGGWIVTKASVLTDLEKVSVKFKDGRWTRAKVVGTDKATDLALLKFTARRLPIIRWANTRKTQVGRIVASSAPADHPAAVGVISVPDHAVARVKPVIGVGLMPGELGPRVDKVYPKSGAAKAGLQRNDYITHANGKETKSREALIKVLINMNVGQKVKLNIQRGEKKLEVVVVLGRPADIFTDSPMALASRLGGKLSKRRNNFNLVIQHDTVLLPNQCGGPLLTLDGKAIGINIARADRTASYAIPAHVVRTVIARLKSDYNPNANRSTKPTNVPRNDPKKNQ